MPLPLGPTTARKRDSREPVDELLRQRLAPEEIGGVGLLEGAQALVGVACLQPSGSSAPRGTERTPKGDILRQVRELGTDVDHVDRIDQALEPDRATLDIFDALDLAREVSDLTAREDLSRTGEAAQSSSQVERASSVAAVDRNSLARVEPDSDGKGKVGSATVSSTKRTWSPSRLGSPPGPSRRRLTPHLREARSRSPCVSTVSRASSANLVASRAAASSPCSSVKGVYPRTSAIKKVLMPGFDNRHRKGIVRFRAN